MPRNSIRRVVALTMLIVGATAVRAAHGQTKSASPSDVIRVADVVAISVAGQPNLTGSYPVADDGSISMALAGNVPAANLTTAGLAEMLRRRLDVYIKSPDVQVTLSRPANVFVLGEVDAPGTFPLTPGLTVVELLARAGQRSGGEVLLVRSPGAMGPVMPNLAAPSAVRRVNLRALESEAEHGNLSRNLLLEPNDTLFVPKVDATAVYVVGQVKKPGPYSIADGTTVLQAITLAGGATDHGSLNGVRVRHLNEPGDDTHRVRLNDPVYPGDSLSVPEAFQLPSVINLVSPDPDRPRVSPFLVPLGSHVALKPAIAVWRMGVDTNVLNSQTNPSASPEITFGPQLGLTAKLGRLTIDSSGNIGLSYFPGYTSENAIDPGASVSPSVAIAPWFMLRAEAEILYTRQRFSAEVDLRARRREDKQSAGFRIRPFSRLELEGTAREWRIRFDPGQVTYGTDLQKTLTETIDSVTGTMRVRLTALSSFEASVEEATHRFPLFSFRDANSSELSLGVTFQPEATLTGSARVGWLQYVPLDRTVEPFDGLAGHVDLSKTMFSRFVVGALASRSVGTSFQPQFPFAIIDDVAGSAQILLSRRFDITGQVSEERYRNRQFINPLPTIAPIWGDATIRNYTGQFGVRFGETRVAASVQLADRLRPASYQTVRVFADVSYGIFRVQGR